MGNFLNVCKKKSHLSEELEQDAIELKEILGKILLAAGKDIEEVFYKK
jgi:hypothetical protein